MDRRFIKDVVICKRCRERCDKDGATDKNGGYYCGNCSTDIRSAAKRLECTEFNVFFLAYVEWFKRTPEYDIVNDHYSAYTMVGYVPEFVSDFVLEVLSCTSPHPLTQPFTWSREVSTA